MKYKLLVFEEASHLHLCLSLYLLFAHEFFWLISRL